MARPKPPEAAEPVIRRGGPADLDAVHRLNLAAFAECWSISGLQSALEHGFDLFVCEQAGQLAGYILSQDILDELHIMQVAVAEPFRRHGLAERLTLHLLAAKAEVRTVFLEVRASNRAAQQLYRKLGFSEIGVRKGYYVPSRPDGEREDALLMRRDIER